MAVRSLQAATLVFLLSLAALGWGVGGCGIATAWLDPVDHVAAQNEAVYAHSAMGMASGDGWLTPKFLGRYALSQPPLMYWAVATAVKMFGASLWSIRLPSLAAAAFTATLVFYWLWRFRGPAPAILGLLLVFSDPLFHALARVAMTDALLALWLTAAMTWLVFDPALNRRESPWILGALAGLALMTKAVAGILPLGALAIFWLASSDRPRARRAGLALLTAAAVALPWYLYQLASHGRWLASEYIPPGQLTFSIGGPQKSPRQPDLAFYAVHLWQTDPVLCATSLLALPAWFQAIWNRGSARAIALAAWGAVSLGAVLAWDARRAWYLLPLIPALALLSAEFFPFRSRAAQTIAAALVAIAFFARLPAGGEPWSLRFAADSPLPSAAALEQYCARHRSNDLIVIEPDDRLYSSDLALAHVRYCYLRAPAPRRRPRLDLEFLGIVITAPEFNQLGADWQSVYRDRLREWHLDSGEPLATAILARSPDEVERMIASHPKTDFSLPGTWSLHWPSTHQLWRPPGGRLFLLTRETAVAPPRPGWRCAFPH